MDKVYICECGRSYTNPQSYNGHKSHCKVHLEITGKYQSRLEIDKRNGEIFRSRSNGKKQTFIKVCKKCGNEFTTTRRKKLFCSSRCSNSRKLSEGVRLKISSSLKNNPNHYSQAAKDRLLGLYEENPRYCIICGNKLEYSKRKRKTCSTECLSKSLIKKPNRVKGLPVLGRHIVYKVSMVGDPRYYIGVRKTEKEYDGYLGSGLVIKRLVKKYGRSRFIRETLFEFDNSVEAFNKEKELLKVFKLDKNCINIADGGQGGRTHYPRFESEGAHQHQGVR